MKITGKLIILCVLLAIIPGIIIGAVGYKILGVSQEENIKSRLMDQSKDWKFITEAYLLDINNQEIKAKQSAIDIVDAQAKMTYELIDKTLKDNNGVLTVESKNDLFKRISRNKVGKTGYIWILNYSGSYVLSKDQTRDGEDIWLTKDFNGNFVIQDLMRIGRGESGSVITHYSYPWLNPGENEPREKIAAMIHFPEVGWVVGVSTYYDDLVDMNYRKTALENVKNSMAAQIIGKTGYVWVVNDAGEYVVSKDRIRDGEDISQSKDTNGVFFIQEAIKKAKSAGDNAAIIEYPWLNKGETTPRIKVAGLTYIKELRWTIGVSAYYDDFDEGKRLLQATIIILFLIILISVFVAFLIAQKISKPIKDLTLAGNKIADGDLSVEIPLVKTNDEIRDLSDTVNLLAGAVKFLQKESEENKKK